MSVNKIAGIFRAGSFSPNHVGSDAAILNKVAAMLRRRGIGVNLYSEDQFIAMGIAGEPVVLTMCRDPRSLARLHQLELEGRMVMNSSYGIAQCVPDNQTRRLDAASVARPRSVVVRTDENVRQRLADMGFRRCWVKKGDGHVIHKEDMTYARDVNEAADFLGEYFIRGIRSAVISAHVDGARLKFYGVEDTDFFHWFFPMGEQTPLDADALRAECGRAARALGVEVYGGDAIVDPTTGEFRIVSVNDWPSYAPCADEAAKGITRHVINRARKLLR